MKRAAFVVLQLLCGFLLARVCLGLFGPPGLALALVVAVGWIYARQSGMSLGAMFRAVLRR